ncbi:MAG: T9SS type A sorting domain-containing protein, partial [Ginsengibacter sp.]
TGNATSLLFENGKTKFSFINAETRQPVDGMMMKLPSAISQKTNGNASPVELVNPSPTVLTSAAIAYDQKHGKLFFASMRTGSLIWLDMNEKAGAPAFYTINKPLVNNNDFNDEALNITRMTIGANGNGYALTNDANHLITFTTGSKIVITDLGNIVDADSNNGISVHNRCSSWGGDMVADASGKLILFTAAHEVFEIDPDSRVATSKGAVLNLPATFSLNGAAVDKDGNVVVSSANTVEGFYKVNMKDLSAVKLSTTGEIFNASDLASSYLLNQNNATMSLATLAPVDAIGNSFITIYPNPVSNGQIKISFENKALGEYKIELTDLQGRLVDYEKVYVKSGGQVENFKLHTKPVKGLYLIKITDVEKKIIYSDKLLIE